MINKIDKLIVIFTKKRKAQMTQITKSETKREGITTDITEVQKGILGMIVPINQIIQIKWKDSQIQTTKAD